ncbi:MAG: hypothetical protein JO113_05240 [Candidatus Eremiobacteraeota bacterium]|nr:hypothetical protein [Candidatus Eremiobacteraeota bacterium]
MWTRGASPQAGLIDVGGTLYGTTYSGGAHNYGTVFSITTGGVENVLYSFRNGTDGANPLAGLIDVKGTLYGTTSVGGIFNGGTVFRITTGGMENVLHSFDLTGFGAGDPEAGLVNIKGTLYGTTEGGGAHFDGTVFTLTLKFLRGSWSR